MAKKMTRCCLLILATATMASGCEFSILEDDLRKLEDISHLFTGTVSSELLEFHVIVIVALNDPQGESIASFRMMSEPGTFEIRSAKTPTRFFGFADMNKDLRFQFDEPYGWAANAEPLTPTENATYNIDWEPFAFVEDGGTGIHFLQPYDPDKVPVLFVHGINGAPRDFTALIQNLDQSRYQPWVLSYPSGLRR